MLRLLSCALLSSSLLLSSPVDASAFFGELLLDNKKVSGFIYEFEGKNYIPIPIFERLGLTAQVASKTIPQCGECIALEDFAEVQKNGINVQIYPFSSFQSSDNRVSLMSNSVNLSGASEQTWAYWVNYRGRLDNRRSLLLDNNLSTPWGTLNARTDYYEGRGSELQNIQFIHENIVDEYEIVVGDINTSRLAWGGNYGLAGIGYFTTDPRLNDVYGLSHDLSIDIESHTELEIIANGRTIYKGFQGAGQFAIEDIFGSGYMDIEVRKNSETADYYQFYFDSQALPEGDTNVNVAFGQFNRGPFRYDYGLAANVEYGITDSIWMNTSFLGTQNNYIAGVYGGISTLYGSFISGFSQSDTGSQLDIGYNYSYKHFRFSASYVDDKTLDNFSDRTFSTVRASYRIGNVSFSGSYINRQNRDVYSGSVFTTFNNGVSLSGNIQRNDIETSFFLTLSFSFNGLGSASLSVSDNDVRGYISAAQDYDDMQLLYNASHSREQGGLLQVSAATPSMRVNARYNTERGEHVLDVNGSLIFDGNNWSAIRNRAQSIGIVEAQGGDIHVSGHFQQSKVNDGHSTALNLPTYRDTTFSLSSRDISSSLASPSATFSSGRIGAYKVRAEFVSPGANFTFSDGKKGDVLNVGGQTFAFFDKVGFFVKSLPIGEYLASVTRDGKPICNTLLTVSAVYTKTQISCDN
nr:hypothetical protein [Alteromonas macleodii]|tara:strand:- start:32096 stop:34171 length:2076 start_codon:yes stop_codon:yes gene_type:complete